jgi:hypothetical protein
MVVAVVVVLGCPLTKCVLEKACLLQAFQTKCSPVGNPLDGRAL